MDKVKHQLSLDDSKESHLKLWDEVLKFKIDHRLDSNNDAVIELLLKGIKYQRKE